MSRVFTRTAKGFRETSDRSHDLPEELHELLKACKGQFTFDQFTAETNAEERDVIVEALNRLIDLGYLRSLQDLSKDPDDIARREAEEVARFEAEEKARLDAEDAAAEAAEEKERQVAEAEARDEAKERARLARAAKARAAAEAAEKAKREEVRERELIKERVRQRKEGKGKSMGKPIFGALVALLIIASVLLNFLPFEGKRTAFEGIAREIAGTEVKIDSAYFAMLPTPRWLLNDVRISDGERSVRVDQIIVGSSFFSLLSLPKEFVSLHFVAPKLSAAAIVSLLRAGEGTLPLAAGNVTASGLVVTGQNENLPPLEIEALFLKGQLAHVSAHGQSEATGVLTADALRTGDLWKMSGKAARFVLPFGINLPVSDFSAKAELGSDTLSITEFSGRRYDGVLNGSGTFSWQPGWRAVGQVELVRMDLAQLVPAWAKDGVVSGRGEFSASAANADGLFAATVLDGKFQTDSGTLLGIDLDKVVQGRGLGDQSRFESIEGRLRLVNGRLEIPEVAIKSGALWSRGSVSMTAEQAISGRFGVEVTTPSGKLSAAYSLGGTADKPQFQR